MNIVERGRAFLQGLWARLRGGTQRVVLALVENVTGVIWPLVVVVGESTAGAWATLFARAEQGGLVLRDFRLRLGRGRNHGAELRLERAALLWAIYHTVEPAQARSERQRTERHPGQSPLAVAGLSPGTVSSLDARAV